MRRLEINTPARLDQPGRLGQQPRQAVQMLYQMHAGDGIHGFIRPAKPVPLQVSPLELAPGRILPGLALLVRRKEAQVRPQLGNVPQCFAVRGAQVEQRAAGRGGGDEPRPGVQPGKMAHQAPIHRAAPLSTRRPGLKPERP